LNPSPKSEERKKLQRKPKLILATIGHNTRGIALPEARIGRKSTPKLRAGAIDEPVRAWGLECAARGESELAPNFIEVVIENKVAIRAVEASS
jgi:hypothetical protein